MFLRKYFFILPLSSAVLLWLSFPGGGELWPLLFVALVPLLVQISKSSVKTAGLCSLFFGLVHFLFLLYWIVIVLGRYGGLHWFVAVLALLLLALYLGSYYFIFGVLAGYVLSFFPGAVAVWLLPTLWVGLDWVRGILFTGMPWMDLGYGIWEKTDFIQVADLLGHHGVTWAIVFTNCLLAILLTKKQTVAVSIFFLSSFLFIFGSGAIYSSWRTERLSHVFSEKQIKSVVVGIVQGNIDQSIKWSASQQKNTIDGYLALSHQLLADERELDLLVWPETALPFYPPKNKFILPLQALTTQFDIALLTGAPWYEVIDRKARKVEFFNSALLLDSTGQFSGKYYKTHLVPFGEYVPLKKFLPFLAPVVEAVGDFTPGMIEQPLVIKDGHAGVLICFESVFPELSRKWVLAGANMLVNLTNDAWYGKSSAPHHSLAMSVFRAVETRRSLVRSANTGISAFINPLGRVEFRSELFKPYGFAADVVLYEEETFWVRYGYLFGPLCLFIGVSAALVAVIRGRSRRTALLRHRKN
ncbi:MAG: apolipoprotein N-acyltransferase [Desulfobulbaceae bacterium S3730MH12]|nr:MAG: apolipoprotein N-acyltransferase [Desulfobulbaceae bacterium S3730MH12]